MKNIHILPTDKLSRLKQNKITKKISLVNKGIDLTAYTPIEIYITNDKEVKDWYIYENKLLHTSTNHSKYEILYGKPIVLATDEDLIKDGVQPIDDDFLEWFVKNPSCEFVEINTLVHEHHFSFNKHKNTYKIIIPKEETYDRTYQPITLSEVDKEETLEEVAMRLYQYQSENPPYTIITPKAKIEGFINGAKWQQEKMYSEEEVLGILRKSHSIGKTSKMDSWITKWFEQFKK